MGFDGRQGAGRQVEKAADAPVEPEHLGEDRALLWTGSAASAVVLGGLVGTTLGLISGYFGGLTDTVLMRLVDVTVAFPFFILVIAIVGVLGPGLANYFVALALVTWVAYARLVRAEVLVVRRLEYVQAARALGFSDAVVAAR